MYYNLFIPLLVDGDEGCFQLTIMNKTVMNIQVNHVNGCFYFSWANNFEWDC